MVPSAISLPVTVLDRRSDPVRLWSWTWVLLTAFFLRSLPLTVLFLIVLLLTAFFFRSLPVIE